MRGYHLVSPNPAMLNQNYCEQDSTAHCGAHNYACSYAPYDDQMICSNHKCIATSCKRPRPASQTNGTMAYPVTLPSYNTSTNQVITSAGYTAATTTTPASYHCVLEPVDTACGSSIDSLTDCTASSKVCTAVGPLSTDCCVDLFSNPPSQCTVMYMCSAPGMIIKPKNICNGNPF